MVENRFNFLNEGINIKENCIYYTGEIDTGFLNLIRSKIEFLRLTNKKKYCTLYLNSDGGDPITILATLDYFSLLKEKHNYKINITVEGRCY
jgi:ATP-dependent protease ClpP protease subunit